MSPKDGQQAVPENQNAGDGGTVILGGNIPSLSVSEAQALAQGPDALYLLGVRALSDGAARALAKHKAGLALDDLTALSDGAAEALGTHEGDLSLSGVKTLSDRAAVALARHRGGILLLDGLRSLSKTAIHALARSKGALRTGGGLGSIGEGNVSDAIDALRYSTVGDVAKVIPGFAPKPAERKKSGKYLLLGGRNIQDDRLVMTAADSYVDEIARDSFHRAIAQPGDFVVSVLFKLRKLVRYTAEDPPAVVGASCAIIRPNKAGGRLDACLQDWGREEFLQQASHATAGRHIPRLSVSGLAAIRLPVGPED